MDDKQIKNVIFKEIIGEDEPEVSHQGDYLEAYTRNKFRRKQRAKAEQLFGETK